MPSNPDLMDIYKQVVELGGKATAAHKRIDVLESGIRQDFVYIRSALEKLENKLSEVIEWKIQVKAQLKLMVAVAAITGSLVSFILPYILKLAGK